MIRVMAEPNIQRRITLKDMIFGKINFCELKNFALNQNLISSNWLYNWLLRNILRKFIFANKCSNNFQFMKSIVGLTSFFSIFFFYINSFN